MKVQNQQYCLSMYCSIYTVSVSTYSYKQTSIQQPPVHQPLSIKQTVIKVLMNLREYSSWVLDVYYTLQYVKIPVLWSSASAEMSNREEERRREQMITWKTLLYQTE